MVMAKCEAQESGVKEEIPHDHLFKVTGLSSTNLEKLAQEAEPAPSDFEEAMSATGYGKFNIALLFCSLPAFWSAVSVTSSSTYIFTRAQCDMGLSLLDMGTITAITYGGMISSAMMWGFLSDTLGRRQIMVWGFFCSGLVETAAAMSQNFAMLLVTKFASGFLFNGPFAVLISYIAELHRTELRARVILLTSLFYTIANTTLPLLAWAILTKDWNFKIYNYFVMHSWNLFLLSTALVPLLTGLAFLCLPESPKFLMSRGRNEEALAVFRTIYRLNTGKPAEDFPKREIESARLDRLAQDANLSPKEKYKVSAFIPVVNQLCVSLTERLHAYEAIKTLVEERNEQQGQGMAALRGGCAQLAPLFRPPHLKWLVLMCLIHMGCMFGSNTIRLWYPHLAAMIGSDSKTLCSAIAPANKPVTDETCVPIATDMLTYLQSSAVGAGSVLTYGIGGVLVNRCGKKLVSGFCSIASAALILMLPFLGNSSFAVVAMVTSALSLTALWGASLHSIMVDLFPTSLRVMAMATFLMSGRLGTITGTIIFPALINYGCLPPFITIAAVLLVCGLACFLVPKTTLKKLE